MRVNRYFLILAAVLVLVFVFHFWGWPLSAGKIFLPFQRLFFNLDKNIGQPLKSTYSKKELIEENKKLLDEVTRLISENIKLKIVEEENEQLRKELNFIKKEDQQVVLANIIGRKEEAGITWFMIDRGKKDGIEEGLVVAKEGVVVGKIAKVLNNISYLLPLADKRAKLAIEILSPGEKMTDENKVMGIAQGRNGLVAEIDFIPIDKEINNDDWVLTSGLEHNVPKGLFIGVLKDVESRSSDLFYNAIIDVPIKLDDLKMVSVIIPSSR